MKTTQWNTISDEDIMLHSRQPAPTCIAEEPKDWDAASQTEGIKVVRETIVHSAEKGDGRA